MVFLRKKTLFVQNKNPLWFTESKRAHCKSAYKLHLFIFSLIGPHGDSILLLQSKYTSWNSFKTNVFSRNMKNSLTGVKAGCFLSCLNLIVVIWIQQGEPVTKPQEVPLSSAACPGLQQLESHVLLSFASLVHLCVFLQ